jgi:hypothetical protein
VAAAASKHLPELANRDAEVVYEMFHEMFHETSMAILPLKDLFSLSGICSHRCRIFNYLVTSLSYSSVNQCGDGRIPKFD